MAMLYPLIACFAVAGCVYLLTRGKGEWVTLSYREMFQRLSNWYMRLWLSSKVTQYVLLGFETFRSKSRDEDYVRRDIKLAHLISGLFGALGCVVTRTVIGFLIGGFTSLLILYIRGKKLQHKGREQLIKQLPDTFRTMGMMLASGKTLMQSCSYIAEHSDGLISHAFGACAISMQLGEGREEALKTLASTLDIECMKLITCSIEVSQLTGAPLQDLLYKAAVLLEDQQKITEFIRVKTSQAQASVKIVVFLPVVIVCGLVAISPEFREGLMTSTGIASLLLAGILDAVAIYLIRRLMRGVERDVIS